jgi:hypothetical protein
MAQCSRLKSPIQPGGLLRRQSVTFGQRRRTSARLFAGVFLSRSILTCPFLSTLPNHRTPSVYAQQSAPNRADVLLFLLHPSRSPASTCDTWLCGGLSERRLGEDSRRHEPVQIAPVSECSLTSRFVSATSPSPIKLIWIHERFLRNIARSTASSASCS